MRDVTCLHVNIQLEKINVDIIVQPLPKTSDDKLPDPKGH